MDVSDNYVDVKFLEWAKDFKSVHKAHIEEEEADRVVKISVSQHLRFSHRISAILLNTSWKLARFLGAGSTRNTSLFTVYRSNRSNRIT
ncbi:hypothetical protein MTR67_003617 [Solanum verrucosum]|uniref:DUF3444 domain-containing protein n=1 Tax=Solanum verrucosum TaxID=315347 RepID=A0AAF0PT44_SOLVR|nr:hypothetical protein MTR67_003617 [Solanum verrucosum]